jgi:L-ribulose-5-phosphate 3-epimerase
MKISVFTDEISPSVPRALELAAAWGVSHVEIRNVGEPRFPRAADADLADLVQQLADSGLAVSAVSPGYFKCPIDDGAIEAGISEGLPRACEWALKLGTSLVSSFAFKRSEGAMPNIVVDYLGRMADVASSAGCRLLLENEAACWGATGVEAVALIRQVGPERIGLCWDPGNTANAGGDPTEFDQVCDFVEHVHLKNFDGAGGGWSVLDHGTIDWPRIITSLQDIGYTGFLILETHTNVSLQEFVEAEGQLDAKEANTLHNLQFLREHLGGG